MFEEFDYDRPVERYGRTLFDSRRKKVISFAGVQLLYNEYDFDPVVFAWQIDPLAHKYPMFSPYVAFNDNPIRYVDPDGRSAKDKVVGMGIGLITNMIPGTSSLRDSYEPDDPDDYNGALKMTDAATLLTGASMAGGGGGMIAAGEGAIVAGGVVTATGVGAPEGAVVAGTGLVVLTTGEGLVVAGTLIMANAAKNTSEGYDRGKKQDNNTNESSSLTKNETTFTQGQGKNAKKVTTDIPDGYKLTKDRSNGQKVFSNGKNYITPDADGHNGGIWKMAKTVESLAKKGTRMGTYDANLKRIGD